MAEVIIMDGNAIHTAHAKCECGKIRIESYAWIKPWRKLIKEETDSLGNTICTDCQPEKIA